MDLAAKLIATSFGIGYFPIWPGAMGSLAAILAAWFLSPFGIGVSIAASGLTGFWACAPAERIFARKDPQMFVMDEVCGMLISVWMMPKTIPVYVLGYLLFRFFDAVKPWPISKIQKHPHSSSIMWDDIAAGLAAHLVLKVCVLLIPFFNPGATT